MYKSSQLIRGSFDK